MPVGARRSRRAAPRARGPRWSGARTSPSSWVHGAARRPARQCRGPASHRTVGRRALRGISPVPSGAALAPQLGEQQLGVHRADQVAQRLGARAR